MNDYELTIQDDLISGDDFRGVLHLERDRATAFCHERSSTSGDVRSGETIEIDLPYYCSPKKLRQWFVENHAELIRLKNKISRYWDGSNWKGHVSCDQHREYEGACWCGDCFTEDLAKDEEIARLEEDIEQRCGLERQDAGQWWLAEIDQIGKAGIAAKPFDVWWEEFAETAEDYDQYLDRDEFEGEYNEIVDPSNNTV